MKGINLAEKLAGFTEHFQPRTVGQFNGHDLMVVTVKGPFVWHKHDETDDFFLVLKGSITIQMRDGNVTLGPGEVFVVPKGVEHCPVAEEEAHILLIEPTKVLVQTRGPVGLRQYEPRKMRDQAPGECR